MSYKSSKQIGQISSEHSGYLISWNFYTKYIHNSTFEGLARGHAKKYPSILLSAQRNINNSHNRRENSLTSEIFLGYLCSIRPNLSCIKNEKYVLRVDDPKSCCSVEQFLSSFCV
jgi:hypothetical protein